MDTFALFVCGVVVTLVAGMGVITSEVFLGYYKYLEKERLRQLKKAQQQLQLEEQEDGTIHQDLEPAGKEAQPDEPMDDQPPEEEPPAQEL